MLMKSAITKLSAVIVTALIICTAFSACNIYIGTGGGNDKTEAPTVAQTSAPETVAETEPKTEAPTEPEKLDLKKYDGYVYYLDNKKEHKNYLDTSSGLKLYYASYNGGADRWSEQYFTVDLDSAQISGSKLTAKKVTDSYGADKSASFKTLTFEFSDDYVVVFVDRDETKLAGGAGQNLEDGDYVFKAP